MGLAALGLIGSVASTGLSIYGASQQASAAKQAARYNAAIAEAEAKNQELQTAEGIKRQRMNNRAALSELRNRLANSGTITTSGSPLTVQSETAGRMELAIADAARASAIQAESLRAKGRMGLWEADQMTRAARISMFGTAIGGAASAFGTYSQARYTGAL
jgi:translation initiation factor 1 (eIF-1/SUI1)